MSRFKKPGIFVENIRIQPQPIEGVSTSTVAFLGETQTGPATPTLVTSFTDFQRVFGGYFGANKHMPYAVEGFFQNGGKRCFIVKTQNSNYSAALASIEGLDEVSIIYSPNAQATADLTDTLIDHCERLKNRFVILDSLMGQGASSISKPRASSFAALYFPWIYVREAGVVCLCLVPSGGHVAGIYSRVDVERGVNVAPANEVVQGAVGLEVSVSKSLFELLTTQGINVIGSFLGRGIRVWGARTLSSDPEWKYVNVRRLLIYLEHSIKKGTAWAVFEPNNEVTWSKVKLAIENFLMQTWRNGMLMGANPQQAYFVKCDRTTMNQTDIDSGRLIVLIGVAPVKPAEFMILRVNQTTASS